MEPFSLEFIGWFYTIVCAVAIGVGVAVMLFLHNTGRLKMRYKEYSIWNDVMLTVIWAIGLGGGIGVLDRSQWGQFLLQLFCWMLIALIVTSAATRLFTVYRLRNKVTINPRELHMTLVSLALMVVPVVLFCVATIISLRTEEARRAFGIS
jgi:hypothetical protein